MSGIQLTKEPANKTKYYSNILTQRRRQWHSTPVLLPRKSHGRRSLVGCSPWGHYSCTRLSDFTFTFHFHALEKEMATHSSVLAWRIPGTGSLWAAIYGVAQSRTRLKQRSSSSSSILTQTEQTDNSHREKNAQLGKISEQYSEMQTSSYNSNHKFIINSIWNIDNNAIIIGGFPVDSVIKNLPAKQET